jgi:stage V sporulation protein B
LGKFFNPSIVAVYNAAKLLFRFYTLLTQSINLLIFPAVSNLQAHQRLSEVKILFEKIVAYYLSLMLILNIILFLGADIVLNFIFAGKYPDSVPIFRIFLLISFFEPLYNLSTGVLYGLGKPEKAFRPLIIAVPLFILLNLGLIPIFQGIGAAIVFGIINVYMAVRLLNSLNKEAGISLGNSFRYTLKFPQLAKDFLSGLK